MVHRRISLLVLACLLSSVQGRLRRRNENPGYEDTNKKFAPLQCNYNLDEQPCIPWSQKFGTDSRPREEIVIPCGECITMDISFVKIKKGLDIQGKLVIEDGSLVELHTPFLRVQGELEITSSKPVDGQPDVSIFMVGYDTERLTRFIPADSNKDACFGDFCEAGSKSFLIAGGKVTLNGLPENAPSWLHLHSVESSQDDFSGCGSQSATPDVLVLSKRVEGKWAPGSEVMITSHTSKWDDQHVRVITKVEPHPFESNHVRVILNEGIPRPSTIQDNQFYAVEVALLSRNIVLQGKEPEELRPLHGGHMTVFHTLEVVQRIEGVEFRNFGQQGVRGRYPIHFEFCGDVSGSVVSKNTIRQSKQRCVVVHGTDNLLVDGNVAFDTAGHCYVVDGGMETGNMFSNNLGAMTRPVEQLMTQYGVSGKETDTEPSTFWMANPSNSWSGNVAAGSHSSAYWLELRNKARGPHWNEYSEINPKEMPLTLFKNNVAHSNGGYALKANGYSPKEQAVFRGFLSFLNQGMPFDFVESEHMRIEGGIFSDEVGGRELGAVEIKNTTILQWTIPSCNPNSTSPTDIEKSSLLRIQKSASSVFNLDSLDNSRGTTNFI